MVAMPSDSPSSVEETVVYRSKDRRFTLIVDRQQSESTPVDGGAWLSLTTHERQRVVDFLNSLESSVGEAETAYLAQRTAAILKDLNSLRAIVEEVDSQREANRTTLRAKLQKSSATLQLLIGVAISLTFVACGVLSSTTAHPLSVPFYFAAVVAGFAAVMTYVGRRTRSDHPPRWVGWLNSIRECLANEPQSARSTW